MYRMENFRADSATSREYLRTSIQASRPIKVTHRHVLIMICDIIREYVHIKYTKILRTLRLNKMLQASSNNYREQQHGTSTRIGILKKINSQNRASQRCYSISVNIYTQFSQTCSRNMYNIKILRTESQIIIKNIKML